MYQQPNFGPVLARHGFLLDLSGPQSRTYVQADGFLSAVWDYRRGRVTVWVEFGTARVRQIGFADRQEELNSLLCGASQEAMAIAWDVWDAQETELSRLRRVEEAARKVITTFDGEQGDTAAVECIF